jgi:hypothetical protein
MRKFAPVRGVRDKLTYANVMSTLAFSSPSA